MHIKNGTLVIIENNAEGSMVATPSIMISNIDVFVQGMTKSTDIGITMSRKIKRVGYSAKELLEENELTVVDRHTITELMTYVNKGSSFEADRGYHDDMVMNCVLIFVVCDSRFLYESNRYSSERFIIYGEQQKLIEDDMLTLKVYSENKEMMIAQQTLRARWYSE